MAEPLIYVEMGGQTVKALLDSGAGGNFIDENIAPKFIEDTRTITGAVKGQCIQAIGRTHADFKIQGTSYSAAFSVVSGLRHPMILGSGWLSEQQCVMMLGPGFAHIGAEGRQTVYFIGTKKSETTMVSLSLPTASRNLSRSSARQVDRLLKGFAHLFNTQLQPPRNFLQPHRIVLTNPQPFKVKARRYSQEKMRDMETQVEEMLRGGIIETCNSPYASPVHLVKKSNGRYRFCVDYRELNKRTLNVCSALPPIVETVRDLGQAQIFSTLDLASGYWQLPLEEKSRNFTAFFTPDGTQYRFTAMPFGLKLAPTTFQRAMNELFAGWMNSFVKVYLDDIIIFSEDFTSHIRHLRLVLEKLDAYGLRITPDKCRIATNQLSYLGYDIEEKTTKPKELHLQQIAATPKPASKKEMQAFLGLVNWVRGYVPDLATLCVPLQDLIQKDKKFRWTPEAEEAWPKLKAAIERPRKLTRPHPDWRYILQTDASDVGMGAVLMQKNPEGGEVIIHYASAGLNRRERKYHCNEKECLAVIWAIRKYRAYLEDRPFTLRTDNKGLVWLNNFHSERAKLTRWSLLLQEFSFNVEHVPGKENQLPDFLSRNPGESGTRVSPTPEKEEERLLPPIPLMVLRQEPFIEKVLRRQLQDPITIGLRRRLERVDQEGPQDVIDESLHASFEIDEEGHIWQRRQDDSRRVYVPPDMRDQVLKEYHGGDRAAHPGTEETLRRVNSRFHWPGLVAATRRYVQKCITCKQIKGRNLQEKAPQSSYYPTHVWETISVDILGPYPSPRPRYAVVVEDLLSKWTEVKTANNEKTKTVITFLEELFGRYGTPKKIIADYGTQFRGREWEQFCNKNGIAAVNAAVEHQRANPVERQVQELKKTIRALLKKHPRKVWHQCIQEAARVIRLRTNRATGESPAKAFLGYQPREPGDWRLPRLPHQQRENREAHDERLARKKRIFTREYVRDPEQVPVKFSPGDHVMVRNRDTTPFRPPWTGPWEVMEKTGNTTYQVMQENRQVLVHVDDLRPALAGHEK